MEEGQICSAVFDDQVWILISTISVTYVDHLHIIVFYVASVKQS